MKFIIDYIPLVAFFIAYQRYDIFIATAVLMVAVTLQMAAIWLIDRKLEKMHIVVFIMVMAFGGLTLLLHDEQFIKWKVTIVNLIFGLGLWVAQFGFKTNPIKQLLGKHIHAPDLIWSRLNHAWALFFIVLAAVNVWVAFYLSEALWVKFKVFGLLGLTILFTFATVLYLNRYGQFLENEETNNDQC